MELQSKRILIAEDDLTSRRMLEAMLIKWNYEVVVTSDGDEAWSALQAHDAPSLAILDWMMPGLDGIEICRKVRERSSFQPVYIILLTTKSRKEDVIEGLEAGADDYIVKPFELDELRARVETGMRMVNMQIEIQRVNEDLANAHRQLLTDVQTIAEIQNRLLPHQSPETREYEFASHYEPSEKAGGDYFDYFFIDEDHLAIVIADVSGHGAPAAVIMAITRVLIHTLLREEHSPARALAILNQELTRNVLLGPFVTVFYSVLDLNKNILQFASAGHNPVYLVAPGANRIDELWIGGGLPLNLYSDVEYSEAVVEFLPGSLMVLYTDGITEARNRNQDMFGENAFKDVLLKHFGGNAALMLKDILTELTLFTDGEAYHDDVTLVVVRRALAE